MNWYLGVLKNYAEFSGRARRKEYWMFYLFNIIVCVALFILGTAIDDVAGFILIIIYGVLTLIPGLAVVVRRLHDTNHSGWWFLLTFVPLGGLIILIFLCLEGTQGDNEYGADPRKIP
ncbi:membrane protein [Xenorhabdus beddingii]|uniref:Membrane protein n=1 Tax=Xenorhabdus beddingii TaxID=40578 RepID=A0A1Y2SR97_9GAMM|nr:DUF805 domain-containing protein [Xenorhabdus beddingii]OTA20804.1 membrane protein [Xenorhabdus beddingii]